MLQACNDLSQTGLVDRATWQKLLGAAFGTVRSPLEIQARILFLKALKLLHHIFKRSGT